MLLRTTLKKSSRCGAVRVVDVDLRAAQVDFQRVAGYVEQLVSDEQVVVVRFLDPLVDRLRDVQSRERHHDHHHHSGDGENQLGSQA